VRAALELPPAPSFDEQATALRERFPYFCRRPDGSHNPVAPFRRSRLAAIMGELQLSLDTVVAELTPLRAALEAAEAGERSFAAREGRAAAAHFARAAESSRVESPRIARGLAQARELSAAQQARAEQIEALLAEARAADRIQRWATVLDRCVQVLALDPERGEAAVLADHARHAQAAEAEACARRVAQLVAQAEPAIHSGRFDRAERLIVDALVIDPDSALALEAQGHLREARSVAQARDQAERAARDAAETARHAAEARRRADALAHAREAEARWTSDDVVEALRLAELALSLERGEPTALRIQGLARIRLREVAETAARTAEAQACLSEATNLLAAGKYVLAIRAARRALSLDSSLMAATTLIADARRREAEIEAARQREAAQHDRDKQIDDMLRTARTAIRAGEPSRAAYTIENALLLNPQHQEAQQLLLETRAAIAAAAEREIDGTVRLSANGAPLRGSDDTAVIAQRAVSVKQIATGLGDWAASLRRRLQTPRD
jgi:hypothetical protein